MAKRKAEPAAEPSGIVRQLTPGAVLKKLRGIFRGMKNDIDEARGTYGAAVGEAVEKKHLHKRAWATALKEDRMEPEALAEYYDHLNHYRDELGLIERAESAPRLEVDGDRSEADDGDEEAENEEPAPSTVRAFPRPSGVAAE